VNSIIQQFALGLLGAVLVVLGTGVPSAAREVVRLAVQQTGTVTWELAVIDAHRLDEEAGLTLDVMKLASPEAGKIALRGGSADVIVSDWLWVSRERSLGAPLVFYPYSSALGAIMAPASSPIRAVSDLKGQKLAIAGGPLDKSWLLLQAAAKREGIDLKTQSSILYGAPALLAQKFASGEMDANLNYWNFCAALEARGFRQVVKISELLPKLGAKGPTAMVGYVFDERWAEKNRDTVSRFLALTRRAKDILLSSDAEWERIGPLTGAPDPATLRVYRDRYRDGVPHRPIADEAADAAVLYRVLEREGGADLVGPARELDAGTFYRANPGD
jgi:NitT/TauT family transport system substrate-binding protein